MGQFEVFANPVPRARASYPFVVMLQADVARSGRGQRSTTCSLACNDPEARYGPVSAQRLLGLGAGAETLVTAAAIPVALLPVIDGNLAAIVLLRRAGVDYSKLQYRGATAPEIAQQIGDADLPKALVGSERRAL